VNPNVDANYLANPPLCVAYAIAGTVNFDFNKDPLGKDENGNDVYLKDIWPSAEEVNSLVKESVLPEMFSKNYKSI